MNGNITTAPLGGNRNIKTKPLFQYDYGQVLKIIGVTLPAAYEVHFSNQLHGVATTQIGNADGVIIPDIYLTTGEPVYAWIYLHTGTNDGETEYTITIPVVRRASISDAEPTPVQQDVITQAIAALNTAVEQTAQDVQDATEAKQDAEEAAGEAYESAVAAAQSAANAGTYAGQAQTAQAAAELAQQKAEEAQLDAQAAQWAAESAQTAAEAAQAGAVAARTGAETARTGAETAQHAAEAARDEITDMSATATTLPAGSQATASYSDGTLTLGIPKGDTGDTGATPDLTIGTVQTLPAGSSATATITGTDEQPVLNLGIPKGDPGEVTQAEFDALADDVSDMQDTLEHKADIDGYYTDMTVGAAEQVVSSTMVVDNAPYKLRTSGGSTDIGNRAYVDKIVGGTVAWNQQVRDTASENVTEYADVVTVTDAVADDAAVSVRVEPVQDLHGYESPWPAGGGVNLLDLSSATGNTVYGFTVTKNDNTGVVTIAGAYSGTMANASFAFLLNVPYIADTKVIAFDMNASLQEHILYQSAPIRWGNTTNGNLAIDLKGLEQGATYNFTLKPLVCSNSVTPTSWTPYANLCPISGWDEVKVWTSGHNLFNTTAQSKTESGVTWTVNADGTVTVSGAATGYTDLSLGELEINYRWGTITISGIASTTNISWGTIRLFDDDNTIVYTITEGGTVPSFTVDLTQYPTATKLRITVKRNNNLEVSGTIMPMVNLGSNAMPFVPYVDLSKATITLPQTVYNATIGSDSGESRWAKKRITAFTGAWGATANGFAVYTSVWDGIRTGVQMCDKFAFSSSGYTDMPVYSWYGGSGASTSFTFILPSTITSLSEANQWIADNGGYIEFTYQLATPTQFSITPPVITTLLGTNNVWSDAGQVALTYTGTDEYLTLTSGRKYMTRINGTDSMVLGAGQEVTAVKGRDNVFDLTQMLGTSVADYVYQQGAGYFRKWFGASRYAYNAGELISVQGLQSRDVVGFNIFNPADIVEDKYISNDTGEERNYTGAIATGWMPVVGGTAYYVKHDATSGNWGAWYDAEKNFISGFSGTGIKTSPANARYARFTIKGNASSAGSPDTLCINLSHNASRNGSYEPYTHRSYPLDSTLTLRGIPKVGTDGVYWDGDEYGYDGGVRRRYGVVDLGTLTWNYDVTHAVFYANILDKDHSSMECNVMCKAYKQHPDNGQNVAIGLVMDNMSITGFYYPTSQNSWVYIKDTSYTGSVAFKAAMSGVYLIYELATPTTETATPYQHIQSVDDWGTEEFVSSSIVPVGHESRYPQNLRDKLQHLPALASSNGSYIITQTDGQMVLSPFPTPPTAAGNYLLKATVSGGNATYSWVAQ